MEKVCRKCKTLYVPTEGQIRKSNYICRPCSRIEDKKYRAKRKADGNPVKSTRCSREWFRQYREKYFANPNNRERRNENARNYRRDENLRHRHLARWITNKAIRSGRIERMPCEVCGKVNSEAHHEDYYEPLKVRWLCKEHHTEYHQEQAKARGQQ